LGNADKFFCAAIVLSTTGSGGSVVWEYFDGGDWMVSRLFRALINSIK
jgi:hypothetical protein